MVRVACLIQARESRMEHEAAFLALIDDDIRRNPSRLVPITEELMSRLQELVQGVEVDLNAPLPDDIGL